MNAAAGNWGTTGANGGTVVLTGDGEALSAGISGTTIANLSAAGHTVTYSSVACPALAGQTYTLAGGGTLTPSQ